MGRRTTWAGDVPGWMRQGETPRARRAPALRCCCAAPPPLLYSYMVIELTRAGARSSFPQVLFEETAARHPLCALRTASQSQPWQPPAQASSGSEPLWRR